MRPKRRESSMKLCIPPCNNPKPQQQNISPCSSYPLHSSFHKCWNSIATPDRTSKTYSRTLFELQTPNRYMVWCWIMGEWWGCRWIYLELRVGMARGFDLLDWKGSVGGGWEVYVGLFFDGWFSIFFQPQFMCESPFIQNLHFLTLIELLADSFNLSASTIHPPPPAFFLLSQLCQIWVANQ